MYVKVKRKRRRESRRRRGKNDYFRFSFEEITGTKNNQNICTFWFLLFYIPSKQTLGFLILIQPSTFFGWSDSVLPNLLTLLD